MDSSILSPHQERGRKGRPYSAGVVETLAVTPRKREGSMLKEKLAEGLRYHHRHTFKEPFKKDPSVRHGSGKP